MSSETLELLEGLTVKLRKEFDERSRELERERDGWKIKYEEQQAKLQALEKFQQAVEVQANDLLQRDTDAGPTASGLPKIKVESTRESPPPSTLSSASSTEQYARTKKLERNYEILKRKYDNLDTLYREARRQNKYLKSELEKKSEQWREWHDWWTRQKQGLKSKASVSPTRASVVPRLSALDQDIPTVTSDGNQAIHHLKADNESMTEDEMDETELFRTTFSPDAVALRRDTQITPPKSHRRRSHPGGMINSIAQRPQVKLEIPTPSTDKSIKLESRLSDFPRPSSDSAKTKSSSNIREIIEIPESPEVTVSRVGRIPDITRPITPLNLPPAVRPRSAPVQNTRKSKLTTPLSTRTSLASKKKEKEYPNMKYWTEDGTDGFNPLPPSPVDDDDGGLLMSLLQGPPPQQIGTANLLAVTDRRPISSTLETKSKTARVRELSEVDSDSGNSRDSGDTERTPKRQKGNQTPSESKLRRQILSPDLASKNKGRGRYSASVLKNDDSPRLGDFQVDPKKNYGVSHPFAEVVRGRDSRKSLTATACPDCARFYEVAGPLGGKEGHKCSHERQSLIQQSSKHRQIWAATEKPPGYWSSDFPTEEEAQKYREEGERRQAEMTRKVAEEAARGDGRWKRKDT